MKKTLKSIVLLGALCGGSLHATFEFRSPLSMMDRGYMHWLLAPVDQAWWYDTMPSEKKHTEWNIHAWGVGYSRTASRAFFDKCDPDKVTRDTASLSQLFFGKEVFRGEDIFAGGTFAGQPLADQILVNAVNPFLAFARISPTFQYDEKGAHMGIDFARYVGKDDRWHVGGRVFVPFKVIKIEPEDCKLEETLDDVFITRVVNTNAAADPDQVEYAMRFDFLNTLVFNQTAIPSGNTTTQPVVRYNNNGTSNASITVVGRSLTGKTAADDDGIPAAYGTKSDDGTVPAVPFRKQPSQVSGIVGANGEGDNGATLLFQTGVDYANNLKNNRDEQGTLFVTPRSLPNGNLTGDAKSILTQVSALVNSDLVVSEPASAFFLDNGINLCAFERIVGVGDLMAEFYFGRGHYDDWFVDGIIGLQFPTGKKQKHANQIYYKPTGNNGHVELLLGLDGGWKIRPWVAFEIRPYYFHAFKRTERRAAPFEGATVNNIGPEVDVKVSWNYFVLRTDFSFFHPHNPDLGFVLGYELFAKGHDKVSLKDCQETATDLLGRTNQPLAVCNLERNTNSLSNKLRGEIFYRSQYFEIFGGGTQMVSGRWIMKETEANIGLTIYF